MQKITSFLKKNYIYVFFSFFFTFFLICSYVFSYQNGFQTANRLLIVILISLLFSPLLSVLFTKLANYTRMKPQRNTCRILSKLFNNFAFYMIMLFIMHLPLFLAYYPGIYTYDVDIQVEQYELSQFIQNHPLIHTLFLGFFKNLFADPNTGYAIATLIQMIIVEGAMAYSLKFIFKKTNSLLLCIGTMLFYGLFPINSLLTLSSTKDTLFSACVLVFFIDCLYFFTDKINKPFDYIRFILNAIFMILLRNNTIYAIIPSFIVIVAIQFFKKETLKKTLICFFIIISLYSLVDRGIVYSLNATPGSIKEMLSIPCQELAHIYNETTDEDTKQEILKYIPEPENYNYYLSDAIKMQLDFDTFDSACKHFLLFSAICNFKYPLPCIDAIFYNTQGYWDLFHCPYSEDHFFLSSLSYRGGAVLDSKIPALCEVSDYYLHTTENIANRPYIIFFNPALYIWIMLFYFVRGIHNKNRQLIYSCLFPLFYLCTLLLSPGAIIRYAFPFVLIAPVLLGFHYKQT